MKKKWLRPAPAKFGLVVGQVVMTGLLLTACGREPAADVPASLAESTAGMAASAQRPPEPEPAPQELEAEQSTYPVPGEPPESDLQRLEFQRYDEIKKMGGMPVTATATGQALVLKPTLYSVRKEECKPTPQAPAGWYECSLIIKLSLEPDGRDPSEQGERIAVKWDGVHGEWVLQ